MDSPYSEDVRTWLAHQKLAKKPFPLKRLLQLYIKNEVWLDNPTNRKEWSDYYNYSLYTRYFAGFKALVSWLGPIEIPQKEYPHVFGALISYELSEIAKICGTSQDVIWHTFVEIGNERDATHDSQG